MLVRQEQLLSQRLQEQEEREMRHYEEAVQLERRLNDMALLTQQETADMLQEKRVALDTKLAERRLELEKERIRAETEGRIAQERANEDVAIRKMEAKARLESLKWAQAIKNISAQVQQVVVTLLASPEQLAVLVAGALALLLLYYLAKEVIVLLRQFVQAQLGKPALVRETSYQWSIVPGWLWLRTLFAAKEGLTGATEIVRKHFERVVLAPDVMERVSQIAVATRNTKSSGAPFRHLLLHGPPGTGKTLIARTLAASSGMDYAVMSGGDVGPLGDDAVNQLHRLFSWAKTSQRGLMLFIDEAEAFLNARASTGGDDSVHRRHALNALLYQTGTQSTSFMLVLATNRPEDLDTAVSVCLFTACVALFHPWSLGRRGCITIHSR